MLSFVDIEEARELIKDQIYLCLSRTRRRSAG